MKKQYLLKNIALMLVLVLLVSCGSKKTTVQSENDKISIVTTIFPIYDWVNEIVGYDNDKFDVTTLVANGVDVHSYQPTVDDIVRVSSCDIFIYVGGVSDAWVEEILEQATNEDMQVINLLDILGDDAKAEELVEGMEVEEEEHEDETDSDEIDEHIWLSLKNAQLFVNAIENAISNLDPENIELYKLNAKEYTLKLSNLDKKYQEMIDEVSNNTVLFGDRFPFRYLFDDYGIEYYAAFLGCSAETEASFETIVFLSNKIDELDLQSVIILENSSSKIAETIIENTQNKDAQILVMDSMQSTSISVLENGTNYISIMEGNLEVLKKALE